MEICGGQTHTHHQVRARRAAAAGTSRWSTAPAARSASRRSRLIDKAMAIAAPAGGDLLLVRRHAPRARLADTTCSRVKARGRRRAHGLFAAGRRAARPRNIPTGRWSSSPSVSRPRRPANAMAVLAGAAPWARAISPSWSRTCWCRRPSRPFCRRPDEPRAGLPGRRACLHGDGLSGI